MSFNQDELGFALSSSGETVYFVDPNQARVLDAVRYPGQASNASYGRHPDGAPTMRELVTPTPGSTNAPALIGDIVINEIMYNPLSGSGTCCMGGRLSLLHTGCRR